MMKAIQDPDVCQIHSHNKCTKSMFSILEIIKQIRNIKKGEISLLYNPRHDLALGKNLVGAPVGVSAAAGGVILVQLAAADGHSRMGIGIAIDIEDEDVTRLAAVVSLARLMPSLVQEGVVQLGHPAKVVAVVVSVAGQAREGASCVSRHGSKLRAAIIRVTATVAVRPIDGGAGIVATGGWAGSS